MSHFLKRNAYANVKIENEVSLAMEREQRIQKDIEEAVGTRRDIENDIDVYALHSNRAITSSNNVTGDQSAPKYNNENINSINNLPISSHNNTHISTAAAPLHAHDTVINKNGDVNQHQPISTNNFFDNEPNPSDTTTPKPHQDSTAHFDTDLNIHEIQNTMDSFTRLLNIHQEYIAELGVRPPEFYEIPVEQGFKFSVTLNDRILSTSDVFLKKNLARNEAAFMACAVLSSLAKDIRNGLKPSPDQILFRLEDLDKDFLYVYIYIYH